MDLSQFQERVRLELLRRIERRTLSVSQLARQTGFGQPHISNFLRGKKGITLKALEKIMAAQRLQIEDLLPSRREASGVLNTLNKEQVEDVVWIPLVAHVVAMMDPYIRPSSTIKMLPFAGEAVNKLRDRCSNARRQWDRFVAIRISAEDARSMEPLIKPDAVVLLDRHYTSFQPYRADEANLYAAQVGTRLVVRYAQFQGERVVLRAYQAKVNAEVMQAKPGETVYDLLAGRVALGINPF